MDSDWKWHVLFLENVSKVQGIAFFTPSLAGMPTGMRYELPLERHKIKELATAEDHFSPALHLAYAGGTRPLPLSMPLLFCFLTFASEPILK